MPICLVSCISVSRTEFVSLNFSLIIFTALNLGQWVLFGLKRLVICYRTYDKTPAVIAALDTSPPLHRLYVLHSWVGCPSPPTLFRASLHFVLFHFYSIPIQSDWLRILLPFPLLIKRKACLWPAIFYF